MFLGGEIEVLCSTSWWLEWPAVEADTGKGCWMVLSQGLCRIISIELIESSNTCGESWEFLPFDLTHDDWIIGNIPLSHYHSSWGSTRNKGSFYLVPFQKFLLLDLTCPYSDSFSGDCTQKKKDYNSLMFCFCSKLILWESIYLYNSFLVAIFQQNSLRDCTTYFCAK